MGGWAVFGGVRPPDRSAEAKAERGYHAYAAAAARAEGVSAARSGRTRVHLQGRRARAQPGGSWGSSDYRPPVPRVGRRVGLGYGGGEGADERGARSAGGIRPEATGRRRVIT